MTGLVLTRISWKAFDGPRSPGEASRELQSIIADYNAAYPSAMAVIEADLPALITGAPHRLGVKTLIAAARS